MVIVCVDYVKGKCTRDTCKYFHPPDHLVAQLKKLKMTNNALVNAINLQQHQQPQIFTHPIYNNQTFRQHVRPLQVIPSTQTTGYHHHQYQTILVSQCCSFKNYYNIKIITNRVIGGSIFIFKSQILCSTN